MRIAFLGFGLIAGSIARALRNVPSDPARSIAAWSPSGAGPAQAKAEGVIDVAARTAADALSGADLVVLGAPVPACLALMDELAAGMAARLAGTAVITDV